MNKKGFTLIELLGTLIIVTLLIMLIVPKILNWYNNSTDKYQELNEGLIIETARLYVDEHPNDFERNNNRVYCISMQTLIDSGYLEEENVRGFNKTSYVDSKVQVIGNGSFFDYYIVDECTER